MKVERRPPTKPVDDVVFVMSWEEARELRDFLGSTTGPRCQAHFDALDAFFDAAADEVPF